MHIENSKENTFLKNFKTKTVAKLRAFSISNLRLIKIDSGNKQLGSILFKKWLHKRIFHKTRQQILISSFFASEKK